MELKHSFTVPAGLEDTWAAFGDLASVAECFPGAVVTESDGDTFKGTAKVKLGPVALQYSGQGQILERDEATHTMRLEAKGKDKRGNGTAGATVAMAFSAQGDSESRVDVTTDLAITGKPAQFGARMMQEVSDKLLGQFVDCLQTKVGSSGADATGSVDGSDQEALAPAPATPQDGAAASAPASPGTAAGTTEPEPPSAAGAAAVPPPAAPRAVPSRPAATPKQDDALDLGATVLPVVLKMYRNQIAAGVVLLVVLRWLWGRRD